MTTMLDRDTFNSLHRRQFLARGTGLSGRQRCAAGGTARQLPGGRDAGQGEGEAGDLPVHGRGDESARLVRPQAGREVQGPTKSISTAVSGIEISEHFPKLAQQMQKLALVRSLSTETGRICRGSM